MKFLCLIYEKADATGDKGISVQGGSATKYFKRIKCATCGKSLCKVKVMRVLRVIDNRE